MNSQQEYHDHRVILRYYQGMTNDPLNPIVRIRLFSITPEKRSYTVELFKGMRRHFEIHDVPNEPSVVMSLDPPEADEIVI